MHLNHDSQDGFSIHHDSRTTKMVDHGVTKIIEGDRLIRSVPLNTGSTVFGDQLKQPVLSFSPVLRDNLRGHGYYKRLRKKNTRVYIWRQVEMLLCHVCYKS